MHWPRGFESRQSHFLSSFVSMIVEAGANGEWQRLKLRSSHLDMKIHDKAADQAEGNLRDDEPGPVDTRVENGTDDANRGIEFPSTERVR